jgi:hypothetical protein
LELNEVFLTFAQAAMVIAGFGGVVVTLRDRSEHWDEWDRIEFRSILEVSGIIIFFSVMPLLLPTLLDAALSWRISILLFAFIHGATIMTYRLGVDTETIPAIFNWVHLIAGMLILMKIIAGIFASIELIQIVHSVGLVWLLGIGGWLFYLLALGAHSDPHEDHET